MAELVFHTGPMDCGKSTLALQLDYTQSTHGRKGRIFTSLDRAGEGRITSRLGLSAEAIEIDPEVDFWRFIIGELTTGLRVERGTGENDFDIGRTGDCGNGALAFLHDAQHLGAGGHVGVTKEVDGLNQRLLEIVVDGKIHVVALLKSIGTCTAA